MSASSASDALREALKQCATSAKKGGSIHINSKPLIEKIRRVVVDYFEGWQQELVASTSASRVEPLDSAMHELLRYAQTRTLKSRYLTLFKSLNTILNGIEEQLITSPQIVRGELLEGIDKRILVLLGAIAPMAAKCYVQALTDLKTGRLSWLGTCHDFRESLRLTLDTMAPDKDVQAESGYQPEKDEHGKNRTSPTMRQKAMFILKSRGYSKSRIDPMKKAFQTVDELIGANARSIYNFSSSGAHIEGSEEIATTISRHLRLILSELLDVR